ncbi:hypothetical protein KGMB02707_06940 [Mesosutterella multiformis]|jgi:hypothetical protein|nr:hypothetical protein KGMB02707_06940 [Mesosutterella multiformis]
MSFYREPDSVYQKKNPITEADPLSLRQAAWESRPPIHEHRQKEIQSQFLSVNHKIS